MAAPTFVAEYGDVWNTGTTPKTVSVTTAVGDVLVVGASVETTNTAINAPTGGTGTWVAQDNVTAASNARTRTEGAVTGITAQTFTLSQSTDSGTTWWGNNCLRFSGSSGLGAHSSTTGAGGPSLGITTTQDNSAIVVFVADWNAVSGTSRTWRTVNSITPTAANTFEVSYFTNASHYTIYAAYYPDAGTAGAKTVGLSAPTGQTYTIAAVEVKGTAGGGGGVTAIPGIPQPYVSRRRAATW